VSIHILYYYLYISLETKTIDRPLPAISTRGLETVETSRNWLTNDIHSSHTLHKAQTKREYYNRRSVERTSAKRVQSCARGRGYPTTLVNSRGKRSADYYYYIVVTLTVITVLTIILLYNATLLKLSYLTFVQVFTHHVTR
jgi:hypothetical protein